MSAQKKVPMRAPAPYIREATTTWPASFSQGRSSKASSTRPTSSRRKEASRKKGCQLGPRLPSSVPGVQISARARPAWTAMKTATPPPRGIGMVLIRRVLGWSTMPTARAVHRTSGVRSQATTALMPSTRK